MATAFTSSYKNFRPNIESGRRTSQDEDKLVMGQMTPTEVTSKAPKNVVVRNPPSKVDENAYRKSLTTIDLLATGILKIDLEKQGVMNEGRFGTSTKRRGGRPHKIIKNLKKDHAKII